MDVDCYLNLLWLLRLLVETRHMEGRTNLQFSLSTVLTTTKSLGGFYSLNNARSTILQRLGSFLLPLWLRWCFFAHFFFYTAHHYYCDCLMICYQTESYHTRRQFEHTSSRTCLCLII